MNKTETFHKIKEALSDLEARSTIVYLSTDRKTATLTAPADKKELAAMQFCYSDTPSRPNALHYTDGHFTFGSDVDSLLTRLIRARGSAAVFVTDNKLTSYLAIAEPESTRFVWAINVQPQQGPLKITTLRVNDPELPESAKEVLLNLIDSAHPLEIRHYTDSREIAALCAGNTLPRSCMVNHSDWRNPDRHPYLVYGGDHPGAVSLSVAYSRSGKAVTRALTILDENGNRVYARAYADGSQLGTKGYHQLGTPDPVAFWHTARLNPVITASDSGGTLFLPYLDYAPDPASLILTRENKLQVRSGRAHPWKQVSHTSCTYYGSCRGLILQHTLTKTYCRLCAGYLVGLHAKHSGVCDACADKGERRPPAITIDELAQREGVLDLR